MEVSIIVIKIILFVIIWTWFWIGVHYYIKRINNNKTYKKWQLFVINILEGPIIWCCLIYLSIIKIFNMVYAFFLNRKGDKKCTH